MTPTEGRRPAGNEAPSQMTLSEQETDHGERNPGHRQIILATNVVRSWPGNW